MATLTHDAQGPLTTATTFLSRSQILDATDACFAQAGYDGTTIRAIAGRLGCAVGSIYRYFHDKRELLLACGRRMLRPVCDALDAGEGFEASLSRYTALASEHAELYRLQFWLTRGGAPAAVEPILERWSELLGGRALAEDRWAEAHVRWLLGREALAPRRSVGASPEPVSPGAPVFASHHEPEDVALL